MVAVGTSLGRIVINYPILLLPLFPPLFSSHSLETKHETNLFVPTSKSVRTLRWPVLSTTLYRNLRLLSFLLPLTSQDSVHCSPPSSSVLDQTLRRPDTPSAKQRQISVHTDAQVLESPASNNAASDFRRRRAPSRPLATTHPGADSSVVAQYHQVGGSSLPPVLLYPPNPRTQDPGTVRGRRQASLIGDDEDQNNITS